MDSFHRMQPGSVDEGNASSVSSIHSKKDSACSAYSTSTSDVQRRAASYSPSYMNAKIPLRKPVGGQRNSRMSSAPLGSPQSLDRQSPATPPPPPPVAKGILLLAIAASPHKSTVFYLESMLKQRPYRQIVILGNAEHEAELKQLKMDTFALLGRMGREIAVQMDLRHTLDEVEIYTSISRAVAEGEAICGLLCSPSYSPSGASDFGVMALNQEQLMLACTSSICFLQNLAKQAIPNFRSQGHEYKQPSLFLITAPPGSSPLSTVVNAACRTLMTLFVDAIGARSITIDYAENIFVPELEPKMPPDQPKLDTVELSRDVYQDDYPPPESPTQLWALYSEFGAAD